MKKSAELARLAPAELAEKARGLRQQVFLLRLQHAQRQLAKPSELRTARRELSRVLTLAAQQRTAMVAR